MIKFTFQVLLVVIAIPALIFAQCSSSQEYSIDGVVFTTDTTFSQASRVNRDTERLIFMAADRRLADGSIDFPNIQNETIHFYDFTFGAQLSRSDFATQADYDTWRNWGATGIFLQVLQAHTVLYKSLSSEGFRTMFAVITNVSCVPSTERVRTTDIAEQDITGLSFAFDAYANLVHFSVPSHMIGATVDSFELLAVPLETNPSPGARPRQPLPEWILNSQSRLVMDAEIHTGSYMVNQCVQNNQVFNGGKVADLEVEDVSYAQTITASTGQRLDVFKIRFSMNSLGFVITDPNITLTIDAYTSGGPTIPFAYEILIPVTDAPISPYVDLRGQRAGSPTIVACDYLPQITGNSRWRNYLVQLNVR